ncbi:MAG: aminopeptidase [Sedimentisphaerales bacterium]
MKSIYEKYAGLLVHHSLRLKKGDKFLIMSTYLAEDLLKEICREALVVGAFPELRVNINGSNKIFYDYAKNEQLKYVSPIIKYAFKNYDTLLTILAPFNLKELENVDPAKKQIVSLGQAGLIKTEMKRAAAGKLNWSLCVFPTDAAAQECGMSKSEYEEFVYSACFLNKNDPIAEWQRFEKKQQRIVNFLNRRKNINFKGNDIDISFSTNGRKWINGNGTKNMPCGEVFTAPVDDSVNGKVRFSYPGFFLGQEIEDISLEVKEGLVIKWDAKKGKSLLDKLMEIPGARRFGEAAVGTNTGIKKFTKNMLFDEKLAGTIHMALGAAIPEAGGKNESAIHWDMLADMHDGGEIYADETLVYKNGRFII